jgi:hypothetical protein
MIITIITALGFSYYEILYVLTKKYFQFNLEVKNYQNVYNQSAAAPFWDK